MLKFSSWNPLLEKFPKVSSLMKMPFTLLPFFLLPMFVTAPIPSKPSYAHDASSFILSTCGHLFRQRINMYSYIYSYMCFIHIFHRLKKRSLQIASLYLTIYLLSRLASILPYLNQPRFTNQATMLPPRTNISSSTAPYPNFHCSSGI